MKNGETWLSHMCQDYQKNSEESSKGTKFKFNFQPGLTLRQRLIHPKDKTPRHKLSIVVCVVRCTEECSDLYIGENNEQHSRATSSGQDSALHLHLKVTSLRTPMSTFWTERTDGFKED